MRLQENSRRRFLGHAARLALASAVLPLARPALAALPNSRHLAFEHTHTGERLSIVYALGERYLPNALQRLNVFLRDHYSGAVGTIDPQLFDLLFHVREDLACDQPFQVISGYRCPETNSRLRRTRGGGVARHSLHMEGKAIDVRIGGVPLADLREVAMARETGGVGFYSDADFVHLDTGRIRYW
ncbi:MAG: DUF882 domain-containing protein [Candidatus Accumulibacter sp.]|uniref:YcbK family protein n=1 Tax=Accumulibacter sp. TaxID=2053492 RepID=UPI0025E21C4B|nr:DUF882 domain-containing protein [Accumulibacter sp.]MCM8593870.1 DUF882 domain-containing protein [Accumulibacter sp.]MCM8626088.1 DUF882 domain-containing protein [Accumulibacter sp.]MDS4048011.1 DUF882 domain-containing protein [Accumulibacter sp.]